MGVYMAAPTTMTVVRTPSPPEVKPIFPEYEIEIALATEWSAVRVAPKVQDAFAAWKAENLAYAHLPTAQCAPVFRKDREAIVRECLEDPKKNYELIDPAKLPSFKAIIVDSQLQLCQTGQTYSQSEEKPILFVLRYLSESREIELLVSGNPRHSHASFLEGRPVAAAGEMYTDAEGKIVKITTQSGHYRPDEPQTDNLVQFLTQCHFASPRPPIQFVILKRDGFCKGSIVYSSFLRQSSPIIESSLIVRIGKIPKILETNGDFLLYCTREAGKLTEDQLHTFRAKFSQSIEWRDSKGKTSLALDEYAKRRLVLVSFAREIWHAKVKDPKHCP
jgi:hypothetical protein